MSLNAKEKSTLWSSVRTLIYLLLSMCFIGFIHYLASIYKENTFAENSMVENIQLGLLLSAGLIFIVQGIYYKEWSSLMFFLASLCFLAGCRELDKTIDELIAGVRWRIGFIFPLIALQYVLKNKVKFYQNILIFLNSLPFNLMFCAMIIIFPIAQCIGHRPLIVDVLGNNQMAATKELFEECAEVMGYFLIFLASIESFVSLVRKK